LQFAQRAYKARLGAQVAERRVGIPATRNQLRSTLDAIRDPMFGAGVDLREALASQSFLRHVLTDPNGAALARSIVALGQRLGLPVIAEGVESWGQRAFLVSRGCTHCQGYQISGPLPAAQFEAFLHTGRRTGGGPEAVRPTEPGRWPARAQALHNDR
jgi:hypothetical protein